MGKVVFYDLSNLYYSAFWISALKPDRVVQKVDFPFKSHLFFRPLFKINNKLICIDCLDSSSMDSYSLEILDSVDFYFKVNFDDSVLESGRLIRYRDKIKAIYPFTPILDYPKMKLLPGMNFLSEFGFNGGMSRIKRLRHIVSSDLFLRLRSERKVYDYVFIVEFYPQENHMGHNLFRAELIRRLRRSNLNGIAGFVGEVPDEFRDLKVERLVYRDYLKLLAQAKVGIYVRGLHDCISFKLLQLMALGLPMVGQKITANARLFYNADYSDVFSLCQFEMADEIVEAIEEIISDDMRLRNKREKTLMVFDNSFNPKAVGNRILEMINGWSDKITERMHNG